MLPSAKKQIKMFTVHKLQFMTRHQKNNSTKSSLKLPVIHGKQKVNYPDFGHLPDLSIRSMDNITYLKICKAENHYILAMDSCSP